VSTATTLRLALDQNFPTPLINAVRPYLPATLDVVHLHGIDPRMSDLDDRSLIIALHQGGWDGLITNNYKMLDVPCRSRRHRQNQTHCRRCRGPRTRPDPGRRRTAVGTARYQCASSP